MANRTASRTRTAPRFSRTGTPARTGGMRGRRQQHKSGPQRLVQSVTSALGGSKASKSSRGRRGGKAGGVALATAAAGMAFKNRDRLMAMFNRRGSDRNAPSETNPTEAGTRATTGPVDPARSGNIAPTDPGNRPDMPPA
jgi:hypothetical protein